MPFTAINNEHFRIKTAKSKCIISYFHFINVLISYRMYWYHVLRSSFSPALFFFLSSFFYSERKKNNNNNRRSYEMTNVFISHSVRLNWMYKTKWKRKKTNVWCDMCIGFKWYWTTECVKYWKRILKLGTALQQQSWSERMN